MDFSFCILEILLAFISHARETLFVCLYIFDEGSFSLTYRLPRPLTLGFMDGQAPPPLFFMDNCYTAETLISNSGVFIVLYFIHD